MAKQGTDQRTSDLQVSFTLLVDVPDLKALSALAKKRDRTRAYLIREAIKAYLSKEAK